MYFSYQTVVLAALALGSTFASPAHRQVHQHKPRALDDVLARRDAVNYNDPSIYKNPVTGKPFTPAEWQCFVEKNGDASCNTIDIGSSGGSSSAPATPASTGAPAAQEKIAKPASQVSSAPASSGSASSGSDSDSGPGAHIFNKGSSTQSFVFFQNDANDYGQSEKPGQVITLTAGSDKFVSLPLTWKGHVQRSQSDNTANSPATWAEFQVQASDGAAWGNISLQKGCDGAVMIISASDTSDSAGFTDDIISGAPDAAKVKTKDGQPALGYTTPGWMLGVNEDVNQAAVDWENEKVGQYNAYILGGTGTKVVTSSNNAVHIEFY